MNRCILEHHRAALYGSDFRAAKWCHERVGVRLFVRTVVSISAWATRSRREVLPRDSTGAWEQADLKPQSKPSNGLTIRGLGLLHLPQRCLESGSVGSHGHRRVPSDCLL